MSLEERLRALGTEVEWPQTPELVGPVRGALDAVAPARRFRRPRARRALVLALVAAIVAAAGAYAASPGLRRAVRDLLGFDNVAVHRVPRLGPGTPRRPLATGAGGRVTPGEAARLASFRLRLPRAVPATDLRFRPRPAGGQVSVVARRAGRPLLFSEFRGGGTAIYIEKALGPGTALRRLTVDGGPGAWLAGEPHRFVYTDARGRIDEQTLRLASNTLLWERGGLVMRLEGARTLREALFIARSVP
jgi:hypothetical protein